MSRRPSPSSADRPESSPQKPLSEEAEFSAFLAQLSDQLAATETAMGQVRSRLEQVRADRERRASLGHQVEVVRADLARARDREIRSELTQTLQTLQRELEELDLALESRLFADSGLKEVFWQAVRFGSLGVVLGWLLKLWAG